MRERERESVQKADINEDSLCIILTFGYTASSKMEIFSHTNSLALIY